MAYTVQLRGRQGLQPPAAGVLLLLQGHQQLVDHQASGQRGAGRPGTRLERLD